MQPNWWSLRPPSPPVKGPRIPTEVVDLVKNFDEREMRTVFANIITNNAEARKEFEEFYDAPRGSRIRPFDFDRCLENCLETLSDVGNDEWLSERYLDGFVHDVTYSVEAAVDRISDVCRLNTTFIEAKLQGVEALLRITDAIEETDEYLTEDACGEEAKEALLARVCDGVEDILNGLLSGSDELFACDGFAALLGRLEQRKELSELSERIKEMQALRKDSTIQDRHV